MASEKLNYAEILADLESKRTALDAAIASLRTAWTLGALGQLGDAETSTSTSASIVNGGTPMELPLGALLGKSMPAAIKIYLSAVKKKQTIREIAVALKDGGVESTSPNFENIVTGALNRLKAAGEVLRFKDGWALADFYPESLRNRLTQDAKPKAKKSAGKSSKGGRPRKSVRKGATRAEPAGLSMQEKIEEYYRLHPIDNATARQIAETIQESDDMKLVGLALGRMVKLGLLSKTDDGKFRLPHGTGHEQIRTAS